MESAFRVPDPFNLNSQDGAQRWAKWRKTFETYFTLAEINKKPTKVYAAILLDAVGEEAQEIDVHFWYTEDENKEAFKQYSKSLTTIANFVKTRFLNDPDFS